MKASDAGRLLGLKGGKARAKKLSRKRRQQIASLGGKAKAAKRKKSTPR